MLINQKNILLALAVFACCVVSVPLTYAQASVRKTTASKKTSTNEENINVPEEALKPYVTKDDAERLLKEYVNKFTEPDMPPTLKQYKESPEKYVCITKSRTMNNIASIKNFILVSRGSNVFAVDPDLLEATGVDSSWFQGLYEAAKKMEAPATAMDKALVSGVETAYVAALKAYNDAAKVLTSQLKSRPKKMDSAKLKALVESNKKRRTEAYIKAYKKMVEEKAKELERQEKAIESSNKKAASAANAKTSSK